MKFLHLADLHLGKMIYGKSLIDSGDQKVWAERFLTLAGAEQPDAVVVAGDVYDRGLPPGKAVRLLSQLVTGLAEQNIPVLMTAGNHDSIDHLSFLNTLLADKKVFISRPMEQQAEITRATLTDEYGPVTFWLLPYVFPAMISQVLGDDTIRDYDTAVRRILEAQHIDFSQRNVLVAHQNVTAFGKEAERGGSESMVGGVGQVDYTAFNGFDYAALGHIHSAYAVGREAVRYAGSPLAYHFNETRQPAKGPLLVTLGLKGTAPQIERKEIEPLHRMREMRGTYDEIRKDAAERRWANEYLKIVLTDTRVTPEISSFLHENARIQGGEVLELTSEYSTFTGEAALRGTREIQEKPVETLFADFYTERREGIQPDQPDLELMTFLGEMIRHADPGQDEPGEKDFQKILDFVLEQEGGRS